MDWAYLAGFVDADGSFFSGKYLKRITIHNTNLEVLERIKAFLNAGSINRLKHYTGHFGKTQMYVYQYTKATKRNRHNADFVAKSLAPFIIVKKEQFERVYGISAKGERISWRYLAGFFDGEGSLTFCPKEGSSHWYFIIVNKDKGILDRIRAFLGCGYVHRHGKNCFRFEARKRDDVCMVGQHLVALSIVKKENIEQMLDFYANHEWHPNYKMKHVSKEELAELYLCDGLSIRKLAEIYGAKYNPMRERLIKFGISLRPLGTNQYSNWQIQVS